MKTPDQLQEEKYLEMYNTAVADWEKLRMEIIERIRVIDNNTPAINGLIEPRWWLHMMHVLRVAVSNTYQQGDMYAKE